MRIGRSNRGRHATWTRAEKLLLAVVGGVVFLDALDLSLVQVALPVRPPVAAGWTSRAR